MVTEARARQVLLEGKMAAKRATAPARRPAAKSSSIASTITPRQMMVLVTQGTLVGCTILAVIGFAWYFLGGGMRATIAPAVGLPSAGATVPPGQAPTMFYRDRGDGTVLVMEIDARGTRIKGVMPKSDVQMFEEPHHNNKKWDPDANSAQTRINALGSAFR